MTVYLVCFDRPLEHARHYVGYTSGRLVDRLSLHAAGRGARILQVCRERGIGWRLARTWPGAPRALERAIKRGAHGVRVCPFCSPGNRRMLVTRWWRRSRLIRPRLRFVVPGRPTALAA